MTEQKSMSTETEIETSIQNNNIKDYPLENGYILWYHSVVDKSWEKDSYINLCQDLPGKVIKTANQLWSIFSFFNNNFTAGMFFLMKEGIMPMWEDPGNSNGGYWSCKVTKRNSNDIWKKISAGFIGNSLTSDNDKMKSITGISISPKISNCVMKIWNNTSKISSCDMFTEEIDCLSPSSIRYNKHQK